MKICLISAIHLWVNPRLIKEADLFTKKGHSVHTITCSKDIWSDERDKKLLEGKTWGATRIDMLKNSIKGRLTWFIMACRQKLFFHLSCIFPKNIRFAEESYYRGYPMVLRGAIRNAADIYIAHGQAALPIAARAARYHGVPYGFDCEDLNAEALADGMTHPQVRKNIKSIERKYLKNAAYVLATSIPMADFLVHEYGIPMPMIIHNVFSKEELLGVASPASRPIHDTVSLVWMSATIGQGRGIEMVIRAMSLLPENCKLNIYGRFIGPDFKNKIYALIDATNQAKIIFHPMPMPVDVMKTIAQHDIGITMDDDSCKNLSLTICNKFFLYMQAGLAVASSNIPGQKSIFDEHSEIGFCIDHDNISEFIKKVGEYCCDPRKLLNAKQQSWDIAMARYNWDSEATALYSVVENITKKDSDKVVDGNLRVEKSRSS